MREKAKSQKRIEKKSILFDSNLLFFTISKNIESMLLSFQEFIRDAWLIQRRIFLFDKDGTITLPNQSLDDAWSFFLSELLKTKKCILLTARDFKTIFEQILIKLPEDTLLQNLIFWCSNGSEIYEWSTSDKAYKKVSSLPGNIQTYLPDIQKWVDLINIQNNLNITIEPRSDTMIALVCIPRNSSKEERENFESLFDLFMSYWYDRSTKHPGILYHLPRTEAFVGFELYHNDATKFRKWYNSNAKVTIRVRAPYPYNLPPSY